MGCGSSSVESEPRDHRHNNNDFTGRHKTENDDTRPSHREHTPPPREPTPPPREPTPPPREPTPPPREPTPPPREPTPSPREPTPPPREPTPPPREPTPPPREPTPPPREPTPPPPAPPRQNRDSDGYEVNEYGMYECNNYDFRQNPEVLDKDYSDRPRKLPFVDNDFGPHIAIQGESVEWKRPGEFRDAPVLFSDGTTRYDIGQGSAGTCWFLSMVAMLADRPNLFHRVVPKDAWDQEGGYFHCFFWRFGEWEEIFIDDYLPIVHGTELWGAKSAEDRNEMWPAMLEKAFARFHGNYNSVYGGQSGDAFLALTGGCAEYIDFDDALEADAEGSQMKKAMALHRRLKNAVQQGECMITTEVPQKYDGKFGLVGGHAYSLTDAATVKKNDGKNVHLVRVRNPWGHTEWKGPWSDGSREWSTVDSGSIPHANRDDGEFWMTLKDFICYFSGVTICSMVPDFDKDGCSDSLNRCTSMFGDWFGETAAGFQNRINNPRYMFELTDDGMDDDGKVPLVVQICQKLKHRKSNKFSIRVDLYKVLGEQSGPEAVAVMELLGEVTNVYKCERQMSNRFKVDPGLYAVVPSCIDAGREKEFLVRVYSPSPLFNVREIGRNYAIMESSEFKSPDEAICIRHAETYFGHFRQGFNAGGQVSNPTYYQNPEIEFEITGNKEQLVNVTVMQDTSGELYPIGLRLFTLDEGCQLSEDESHQHYLYDHYDSCPRTMEGQQGAFIAGSSADITHKLGPGRYFVIFHMDSPSQQKRFSVIIRSSCHLNSQDISSTVLTQKVDTEEPFHSDHPKPENILGCTEWVSRQQSQTKNRSSDFPSPRIIYVCSSWFCMINCCHPTYIKASDNHVLL